MISRSAAVGWNATTGMPRPRSAATSRASDNRAIWRIAVAGPTRVAPRTADIGALMRTRSGRSVATRSLFVVECTPPST